MKAVLRLGSGGGPSSSWFVQIHLNRPLNVEACLQGSGDSLLSRGLQGLKNDDEVYPQPRRSSAGLAQEESPSRKNPGVLLEV